VCSTTPRAYHACVAAIAPRLVSRAVGGRIDRMVPSAEESVRALHRELLERWNRRDAAGLAALFTDDGNLVGFDGSQVNGRMEIEAPLRPIFADHPTAAYVGIVRGVRQLDPEVAVLRAVVGMVPPGQTDSCPR